MVKPKSPIRSPADVRYLTFQGGGGLGFAYIGAIEALEASGINVLPITPGIPGQLRGISGASAGAITALLLALGCRSADFLELFSNKQQFADFYDAPRSGHCRGLTPSDYHADVGLTASDDTGQTTVRWVKELYDFIAATRSARDDMLKFSYTHSLKVGGFSPALVLMIAFGYGPSFLERKRNVLEKELPFLKQVFDKPQEYLFNLINDRGIFPGFTVRKFLANMMRKFIGRAPAARKHIKGDPADTTFATFRECTGIDLVISGTNISQRRSQLFSADRTPEFPVVEAVGISACYPLVFKPIYVKAPASDKKLGPLRGLWLDGGILNNFPIHAFDRDRSGNSKGELNPNVLGLMLNDGDPDPAKEFYDPEEDKSPLGSLAGGLLTTILTPGNKGQLRTPQEALQMIPLYTYELSLFEFAPAEAVSRKPRLQARSDVLGYFRR
jgi:predicted acylesterase/phospholipase RssA